MKYILFILLSFVFLNLKAQLPTGVPTQKINGWAEANYYVPDSGAVAPKRDTLWVPRFPGTMVTWYHAGVDTAVWFWNSSTWNKLANAGNVITQNIANASLKANGTYLQNWNHDQLLFDTVNWFQVKGFENDATFSNRKTKYTLKMFPDFGALPLDFSIQLRNIANNADSLNNGFFVSGNTTTLSAIAVPGAGTLFAQVKANANSAAPSVDVRSSNAATRASFITVWADSIDVSGAVPASTADSIFAFGKFKSANGSNKLLKIPIPVTGGAGTVTSVGLTMPTAFTVTSTTANPITTNGTFNVTANGTSAQYIKGNGVLGTTDTSMIPSFFTKVRSLFSGTSPITYNTFTGAIGINNATSTGTKGAASFTSSFSDNGVGQIDLATLVSAGSCSGCILNIDAKGRITGYATGAGGATNNVNIGSGLRILNATTQEMRTLFAGFGTAIDSVSNTNGLTWRADTTRGTGLPTYYYIDSSVGVAVPGGSTTQVQTNIAGSFHGDAGLTYDTLRHTVTTDSVRAIRINSDTVRIKIASNNSAKNVYFFGTSITLGYYTQDASNNLDSSRRWSTYVSRSEGWTEHNYGIAGLLMQNRSPSATNMITNRLTLVPTYNSTTDTTIFFEFGINDQTKTGQGLTNYNTTNFITDYTTVIDTVIARGWPLNRIYLIASNYVDTSLNLFNTYTIQLAYYNATKTVATNLGVNLIDVYQNSFINRNNFFYSDGLHPSNTGHSIYAIKVLASLGASVTKNNQTLAANGLTELQKIAIKQTDTTNVNYQVIGIDQYNNAVKIANGYFIENNPLVKQYGGINLYGDIFCTRLQATGLVRATGNRVGTNLTGSGPEIYWDGSTSYLSSLQETPSVAWKPLDINQGGSFIGLGIAHNSTDPILTTSVSATGYIRAKGSFPSTFTGGDEVFIGTVSHVGYIASFDGTGLTGRALSINNWGHNVMVGTDVDDGVGALQVKGKLTVSSHAIGSNSDSAVMWDRSTNEYKVAKINGAATTLYTGDGTLAGNRSVSGGTNTLQLGTSGSKISTLTSNVSSAFTINSDSKINLFGAFILNNKAANDADYTVTATDEAIRLPTISANRTVTINFNVADSGRILSIYNDNNSANTWNVGTAVITAASGATFSFFENQTHYLLQYIGVGSGTSQWRVLSFEGYNPVHVSSSNVTMAYSIYPRVEYIAQGTTSTYTLPTVSSSKTGFTFSIKNQGSGAVTINSNGGGNDIYNTSATNTYSLAAGASVNLMFDGTYFNIK